GVDAPHIKRAIRQHAECAAAADIGDLEPNALLGANAHHCKVAIQLDARALEGCDRDKPGHHTCRAVKVAAMRDGVEMRTDDDALPLRIAAGEGHVEVGSGIML